MKTSNRINSQPLVCSAVAAFVALIGVSSSASSAVMITNDPFTFFNLEKPTGEFDEPGLSGFEYLLSCRTGEYRANDQYLIAGEESTPTTSLVADLGGVAELSSLALDFSIQYNLIGGRNFTFTLDGPLAGTPSVLCWGDGCSGGSTSAQTIDGLAPITQYNGLQIQVRAQEVAGSSVTISNLAITGVDIAPGSAALFDGVVTPATTSTIPGDSPGRVAQWLLGDSLDLVTQEWDLSGTVTLTRPDAALEDLTKVRLAVDLVNDMRLATIPLPATAWLVISALGGLVVVKRKQLRA
jgi:hypothetical protein